MILSSPRGEGLGTFTLNFYDDATHVKPVSMGVMAEMFRDAGLEVIDSGVSRNLIFVASHLLYRFAAPSRKKYTALAHWIGWSAFVIARQP